MNRRLNIRTAWIAICAVLFHALIPLAHANATPGGFMSVLCSIDGEKLVFVPAGPDSSTGNSDSQHPQPHDMLFKCPLCTSGAHFALTSDPGPAFTSAILPARSFEGVDNPAVTVATLQLNFSPRAPPLV